MRRGLRLSLPVDPGDPTVSGRDDARAAHPGASPSLEDGLEDGLEPGVPKDDGGSNPTGSGEPTSGQHDGDIGESDLIMSGPHARYYGELTAMLERLHRRYLDVVRLGLESIGVNDINASQALILLNVGEGEVPIRDLVQRGYYLASSASYNIKKLVDYGYLEQVRNQHDRRSVRLKLGDDGRAVVERLKELDVRLVDMAAEEPELLEQMDGATKTLRKLERVWAEFINFG
jgi:DNA-binding MarR family transcriptional regulator